MPIRPHFQCGTKQSKPAAALRSLLQTLGQHLFPVEIGHDAATMVAVPCPPVLFSREAYWRSTQGVGAPGWRA